MPRCYEDLTVEDLQVAKDVRPPRPASDQAYLERGTSPSHSAQTMFIPYSTNRMVRKALIFRGEQTCSAQQHPDVNRRSAAVLRSVHGGFSRDAGRCVACGLAPSRLAPVESRSVVIVGSSRISRACSSCRLGCGDLGDVACRSTRPPHRFRYLRLFRSNSARALLGALLIPPGVGHAFVSAEPTTHLYATDEYWDPTDEFGCRWDDSALGLDWPPIHEPLLSERDAASGSYAQLEVLLRSHVL